MNEGVRTMIFETRRMQAEADRRNLAASAAAWVDRAAAKGNLIPGERRLATAFRHLETLGAGVGFDDNDEVESIHMLGPRVNDSALGVLKSFPQLQELQITGGHITDDGFVAA